MVSLSWCDSQCSANSGRWHERSKSCCDNGWEWNPPKAQCPKPKWCPKGWFWHKDYKKCKPQTPTAPEPDCDEWDEGNRELATFRTKDTALMSRMLQLWLHQVSRSSSRQPSTRSSQASCSSCTPASWLPDLAQASRRPQEAHSDCARARRVRQDVLPFRSARLPCLGCQ